MRCPYCKAEIEKTTLKRVLCMKCFQWVEITEETEKELVCEGTAGIEYRVEKQTAAVTAYHGTEEHVKIADAYGLYPVTKIGAHAFAGCRHLKEIQIPDWIEQIEKEAFKDCLYLKKVKLGDNLKRIEEGAFYHCVSLTEVSYRRKPQAVAVSAFSGCYQLPAAVKNRLMD